MVVESEVAAGAEPPPDTLAELTSEGAALAATFTVTAIAGKLAPGASTSGRVQGLPPAADVHPVPPIATSVSPLGRDSVTVTVPLVGLAPAPLVTRSV